MSEIKPTDTKQDPVGEDREKLNHYLSSPEGRSRVSSIFDDFDEFYDLYRSKGASIGTIEGEMLSPNFPAIISDSGRLYEFRALEMATNPAKVQTGITHATQLIGASNNIYPDDKEMAIVFFDTGMLLEKVDDPNGLIALLSPEYRRGLEDSIRETQKKLKEGGSVVMIGVNDAVSNATTEEAYRLYLKQLQVRKNSGVELTYENTEDIRESLRTQGIHVIKVNLRVTTRESEGEELTTSRSVSISGVKSRSSYKVRKDLGIDSWSASNA